MCEWIRVEDRLPEKEGLCFVYARSYDPEKLFIKEAWYDAEDKKWRLIPVVWAKAVSHWMPKPPPPLE